MLSTLSFRLFGCLLPVAHLPLPIESISLDIDSLTWGQFRSVEEQNKEIRTIFYREQSFGVARSAHSRGIKIPHRYVSFSCRGKVLGEDSGMIGLTGASHVVSPKSLGNLLPFAYRSHSRDNDLTYIRSAEDHGSVKILQWLLTLLAQEQRSLFRHALEWNSTSKIWLRCGYQTSLHAESSALDFGTGFTHSAGLHQHGSRIHGRAAGHGPPRIATTNPI